MLGWNLQRNTKRVSLSPSSVALPPISRTFSQKCTKTKEYEQVGTYVFKKWTIIIYSVEFVFNSFKLYVLLILFYFLTSSPVKLWIVFCSYVFCHAGLSASMLFTHWLQRYSFSEVSSGSQRNISLLFFVICLVVFIHYCILYLLVFILPSILENLKVFILLWSNISLS